MSAQERAEAGQQVAALRWQVQKLWVDAVVSRQSVAHSRDILAVAEAGAELGQRMASVGNWSRARQIQEELPLWAARTRLDQAQLQAERALQALWQRVGAGMTAAAVAQQLPLHLPDQLPLTDLDATSDTVAALQAQALQAHLRWPLEEQQAQRLMSGLGMSDADLQAAQQAWRVQAGQDVPMWQPRNALWGHAFENAWQARTQADSLARQVGADVQMALSAYQMARHAAHTTQAEVLRLHTELSQETLLRYNGMLTSTWDLLTSARTRIDSVDAALQAQRQAWLAHADLMAVLAGLPYSASADAPGASGSLASSKPNTAGH
jgi:outer membrane protein TolC